MNHANIQTSFCFYVFFATAIALMKLSRDSQGRIPQKENKSEVYNKYVVKFPETMKGTKVLFSEYPGTVGRVYLLLNRKGVDYDFYEITEADSLYRTPDSLWVKKTITPGNTFEHMTFKVFKKETEINLTTSTFGVTPPKTFQ